MSDYTENIISMAGGDDDGLDLDAIQARAEAATKGPWDFDGGVVQSYELAVRTGEYSLERIGIIPDEYVRDNDAEFIAAARTDVPALLALVREQATQLEGLRTDMQDAMADAWDEGHRHYGRYFSPNFPEFGVNPHKAQP